MRIGVKAWPSSTARLRWRFAKAYESVNQVLDFRQQANSACFEENMERRKLEL